MFLRHFRVNIQLLLLLIRRKQEISNVLKGLIFLIFTQIRIQIRSRIVRCDAGKHLFILIHAMIGLTLVVYRYCALLVLRGNFSVMPSLDLLVDVLVDSVEFVQHGVDFLQENSGLRTFEGGFELKEAIFSRKPFGKEGQLPPKAAFHLVQNDDQLPLAVRHCLQLHSLLQKPHSFFQLIALQPQHGLQKNSFFIIPAIIKRPFDRLLRFRMSADVGIGAGQAETKFGEGKFILILDHMQGEEVEIGDIVEMVEPYAEIEITEAFRDLLQMKVGDGPIGKKDRSGRLQQDAVVEQRQTDLVVALTVHFRRFVEQTTCDFFAHRCSKILLSGLLSFRCGWLYATRPGKTSPLPLQTKRQRFASNTPKSSIEVCYILAAYTHQIDSHPKLTNLDPKSFLLLSNRCRSFYFSVAERQTVRIVHHEQVKQKMQKVQNTIRKRGEMRWKFYFGTINLEYLKI